MKRLVLISLLVLMTGCTYSVSNVISSGSSDVVDDEQSAQANPNVSVPVKPL